MISLKNLVFSAYISSYPNNAQPKTVFSNRKVRFVLVKYLQVISTILVIFCLAGCSHGKAAPKNGYIPVTHVVDGDTIDVKLHGRKETVRFLLIDTPETVHPNMPIQPFGPQAHKFTQQLLAGQYVKLEIGKNPRDKYGRLLAYVYMENGEMVNKMLLRKGLARVAYVFPPDTKYLDSFRHIEKKARSKKLGIWSVPGYATGNGFITDKCGIKGNIGSGGRRIYHMPGDPYYEKTNAEAYFCTKKAAVAAGFQAPNY